MDGQKLAVKRSLARKLAITFSAFVLVVSLAVAGWMAWWFGERGLEEFREMAEKNAAFVSGLRLPRSQESADRLEGILGCEVAFAYGDGRPGDWPLELEEVIRGSVDVGEAVAVRAGGMEVAVAPIGEAGEALVLMREGNRLIPGFVGLVLAPTLVFTLGCAVLAVLIGRRIIGPLGTVAGWLPNLDVGGDVEMEPMPGSITGRGDEIGELARKLEETGGRLVREQRLRRESERLATLGRIATSLAHEIKNPVAAIGLHADLLGVRGREEDRESLEMIREEVVRITDLVNQWLYVARSRPGKKKWHAVRGLVEGVCRRLRPILEHARGEVSVEGLEGEAVWVEVDAPRVEQAVRNLLLNAAQAMPEGGRIRVGLRREGGKVTVSVEDEGPGFSAEARRRFGEPFFSEREGGMGIGLTLVREVVAAHGGEVVIRDADRGRGARVECTLPCAEKPGGEE